MGGEGFFAVALAVLAGVTAQVCADRLRMPSIVLLLGAGMALGADGFGWLDPAALGAGRGDIVTMAVTVILFEGALGLDLDRLQEQRRPLLLLLTVGAALSMGVGTLAAHGFLGLRWSEALLFGAIMIVTGPTVVTPLVSRIPLGRSVRELLVSEGVLIDPIGAIVALVVAEALVGHSGAVESGSLVLIRLGVGLALGVAVGLVLSAILRRGWLAEELQSPLVLAVALMTAALASRLSAESGLMAAVAQGITLANRAPFSIGHIRVFKETLTIVLLGFLFVVLAADVRLSAITDLGWSGLAVVAALVWVARPAGVWLATRGGAFTGGERAFLAWVCPRGVVAVSVAGFFRVLLDDAGQSGGATIEALTFLTVAATVAWQGLTAGTAARVFGADRAAPFGTVIIGADALGRLLGRTLADLGRQVVLVDRNPWFCRTARRDGLAAYEGDALSIDVLSEVGVQHASTVIALTRNRELNALVAQRIRGHFKVERVLALAPGDPSEPTTGAMPFPGDFAGADRVNALVAAGELERYETPVPDSWVGHTFSELEFGAGEFALAVAREPSVLVATADLRLEARDRLFLVGPPRARSVAGPAHLGAPPAGDPLTTAPVPQ